MDEKWMFLGYCVYLRIVQRYNGSFALWHILSLGRLPVVPGGSAMWCF